MSAAAGAGKQWRIGEILQWTHDFFRRQGIESARLDAEVLLAHTLQQDRIHLYTHYDQPLNADEANRFGALVRRRKGNEPVAYIVGHKEFYGLEFAVGPDVLIPRPATEHLIEVALAWRQAQGELSAPHVLDVGTGSGAIAVTLAKLWPDAQVTAVDISPAALAVARHNAEHHDVQARLSLLPGDLFAPCAGDAFDLIVSNPPYVRDDEALPATVGDFEPTTALRGGGRWPGHHRPPLCRGRRLPAPARCPGDGNGCCPARCCLRLPAAAERLGVDQHHGRPAGPPAHRLRQPTLSVRAWALGAGLMLGAAPALAAGPAAALVDAARLPAALHFDIRYATPHNFVGKRLYAAPRCLLRPQVARQLLAAQRYLDRHHRGLHLLLKDCYRPLRVQRRMFAAVRGSPRACYVADPSRATGSVHTYGAAVDVTLCDAQGRELDLGTGLRYPLAPGRAAARAPLAAHRQTFAAPGAPPLPVARRHAAWRWLSSHSPRVVALRCGAGPGPASPLPPPRPARGTGDANAAAGAAPAAVALTHFTAAALACAAASARRAAADAQPTAAVASAATRQTPQRRH